jgi:hypothetical protein
MVKISGATGLIATCIVALPLLELTAAVAAPAGRESARRSGREEQPEGSPDRYSHRGIVVETADSQMNEGSGHRVRRRVIGVTAFKILAAPARGSNRVFVADRSAEIAGRGATHDVLARIRPVTANVLQSACQETCGGARGRTC